jgi:hypothetical protein
MIKIKTEIDLKLLQFGNLISGQEFGVLKVIRIIIKEIQMPRLPNDIVKKYAPAIRARLYKAGLTKNIDEKELEKVLGKSSQQQFCINLGKQMLKDGLI